MEQLAEAATLAPQVLVSENEPAFAPVIAMLLTVRAALPVLLRVAVWAELAVPTVRLPKSSAEGVSTGTGAGAAAEAVPESSQ